MRNAVKFDGWFYLYLFVCIPLGTTVSGWMFLLVPAYPGCPGSKAVKRSLLLLLLSSWCNIFYINTKNCSLSLVLTATDQKKRTSSKGDTYCLASRWHLGDVIVGNVTFLNDFFAVFDPSPLTRRILQFLVLIINIDVSSIMTDTAVDLLAAAKHSPLTR